MFDAAAGHCNEWVGRVWGENAGEEVKMLSSALTLFVEFFVSQLRALWGESVVRKYWVSSVWGVVGGQDDIAICGRM